MKKCILCGKEHDGGCDKSEWDGVLKQKYNVPSQNIVSFKDELYVFGENTTDIYKIEDSALKEQERQHIAKKRGRKPKNG